MKDVYLSIGTNMGERYENLQKAIALLREKVNIEVVRVSSVYETAAVGYTDQADFLNIAVHLKTDASSTEMLKICQSIEQELGRVREFRWGPRIIDLDILLYNHEN
ncbi:2-amino-4-hydroxy-6-hydroxymethyldihydropteridine diphosphokinase, partial [Bacillus thuringiensis]